MSGSAVGLSLSAGDQNVIVLRTETSTYYYAVDACRVIPALIKAYRLTGTTGYFGVAKLANATFLYNMQHPPTPTDYEKHLSVFRYIV